MTELVHISGAKEMEEVLKQLPQELAKRAMAAALREGAQVVLEEARARAPIGFEAKGRSRLRRSKSGSVSVSNYGKLKPSLHLATVPAKKTAHSMTVVVSVSPAFWGMFVEFGTRFMKAQPFMRPAFESKKYEALEKMGKGLGDAIEKVTARLAGSYRKSGLKR